MPQTYDIYKFFDKEVLHDVMNTLYELGVDEKAYRTWYKLNENTNTLESHKIKNTEGFISLNLS